LECYESIDEEERRAIGDRARQKVLKHHTAKARAEELQEHIKSVMKTSEKI